MADDGLRSVFYGQDVTRGLRVLNEDLRKNRKGVTLAVLSVLQAQTVEELSHPGTGKLRVHRLTKRKGRRLRTPKSIAKAGQRSAPGEPPAPDTGKLRGSIQIEYDDVTQKGRMGTNDKKAAALNFGTRRAGANRRTVILPRPFMEPALKKAAVAMTAAGLREMQFRLQTRSRV